MGRELKRVALDFDWPLGKCWEGYVNPHYVQCDACGGRGSDAALRFVEKIVRLLILGAEDSQFTEEQIAVMEARGRICPHPYLRGGGLDVTSRSDLGSEGLLLDLVGRLSGREPQSLLGPFAMGDMATWSVSKKLLEAAGLPEDWGYCKECGGEGIAPEFREAYEAWESWEPPEGQGYQLWETTSEGSPISPVFSSLDALCEWAAENATTFGSHRTGAAEWKKMLEAGFVCHVEGNAVFI